MRAYLSISLLGQGHGAQDDGLAAHRGRGAELAGLGEGGEPAEDAEHGPVARELPGDVADRVVLLEEDLREQGEGGGLGAADGEDGGSGAEPVGAGRADDELADAHGHDRDDEEGHDLADRVLQLGALDRLGHLAEVGMQGGLLAERLELGLGLVAAWLVPLLPLRVDRLPAGVPAVPLVAQGGQLDRRAEAEEPGVGRVDDRLPGAVQLIHVADHLGLDLEVDDLLLDLLDQLAGGDRILEEGRAQRGEPDAQLLLALAEVVDAVGGVVASLLALVLAGVVHGPLDRGQRALEDLDREEAGSRLGAGQLRLGAGRQVADLRGVDVEGRAGVHRLAHVRRQVEAAQLHRRVLHVFRHQLEALDDAGEAEGDLGEDPLLLAGVGAS